MAERKLRLTPLDPVWSRVCEEAEAAIKDDPLLGGLIHSSLLHHATMEQALAYRFSFKLASPEMGEQILREIADQSYRDDPALGVAARADLMAVFDRDPACHRFIQPILFFKGYQAVQAYRIGHWLWTHGRRDLAYFVQMRVSEVFGVDIHPGARVGKGIMIDHAHSIVIGETAVVGDNVSMLHSVTLGGTGKEDGDRHPKIGDGVLIGAGAKVLGTSPSVTAAALRQARSFCRMFRPAKPLQAFRPKSWERPGVRNLLFRWIRFFPLIAIA